MKKYLKFLAFISLLVLVSCVSEYELNDEFAKDYDENIDQENPNPLPCTPYDNTVINNGVRVVYDDIFYSNIWPGTLNNLTSGKILNGQDNQTGSRLHLEFNKELTEGIYTVSNHTITGSIEDDELVMSGTYRVNGNNYDFFAQIGSKVYVSNNDDGKWTASFCAVKFTIAAWTGLSNNFTTDGNLIQTYP